MHLAYRWLTGLGFDKEVLSSLDVLEESTRPLSGVAALFLELFERIVQQCMNVGPLKGIDLSVDSTQNAPMPVPDRTITREQPPEVAKVNRTVHEYVE
jgi:hypothetical protein